MEALKPEDWVTWSVAERPLPGQLVSGDRAFVERFPGGALLAVIDGLGHGQNAATASEAAAKALAERPDEPVLDLLRRCHAQLSSTRGAVMTLVSLREADGAMEWVSVGNVEAAVVRASPSSPRASLMMRGGVVGYHLPAVRASSARLFPGDTLVLATDGIRHSFADVVDARDTPEMIAPRILALYGRDNDDALALVARYEGGAP